MGKFYRQIGDELKLVVRGLAWLNTHPEGQDRTRREKVEDAGGEIDFPDCSAPFLIETLLEIGPAIANGFSMSPISWRDIEAWQSCTAVALPPWQSRLLISLSREYVSFAHIARQPTCRAPWDDEEPETRRERVSNQLKAALTAIATKER